MMTIGQRIQQLRMKQRLTQEQLADSLGVARQTISKWELDQAVPDVERIIRLAALFAVTTDAILLPPEEMPANPLHLGSIYLIVKDFEASVAFYERFLDVSVADCCRSGNKFVEFFFDGKCLSLMNESNLHHHITDLESPYKFVQNYWVDDLRREHERVRALQIGEVTEILEAHPAYHYFHLLDPDRNVIEVTGGY